MTQTILFKDGLRIGKRELQLMQSLGFQNVAAMTQALADTLPAVVPASSGVLGTALQVTASGTNLTIAAGSALLQDGTILEVVDPITPVAVEVGATNAQVILAAVSDTLASGSMALAADRVTLTYTPTEGVVNAAALYQSGDSIRLINSGTPLGTFLIDTVSGNTINLAEVVPGSGALSGLDHAIAGKFFAGYPLTGQTTDLVSSATPSVRIETAGYTPLSSEILLARVTRTGGTVTVTDARVTFRARGINNIVNSMVAANASIDESKLALSSDLLKAKQLATKLALNPSGEIVTNQSNLYVTRDGVQYRVLVANDGVLNGFSGFTITPSVLSTTVGTSTPPTITANAQAQAGVTVTYTFTSTNPAVLTVTPSGSTATITPVAAGFAQIIVQAQSAATATYAQTTEVRYVSVTVAAGAPTALSTLTITPDTASVALQGTTVLTATTTAPAGVTPSLTYTWTIPTDSVGRIEFVGDTNQPTATVRGLTSGNPATVQLAVAATATGYASNTLTDTATINVASNQALLSEPNFRVRFTRTGDTTNAIFRWGIGGSSTASGLNITMTVAAEDRWNAIAANALTGQAFYDSAGRRYRVASNAEYLVNGTTLTFAVTKLNAADPNPTNGVGVIRSFASAYRVAVFDDANVTQIGTPVTPESTATREVVWTSSSVTQGTPYKFRLTALNDTLTPASLVNTYSATWGTSVTGTVDVPVTGWIVPEATPSGINFTWSMLKDLPSNAYDPTVMDYYVRWNVGDLGWSVWHRVDDNNPALTSLSYFVYAPPSTLVNFQVKITNLSGTSTVNSVVFDGAASATTMAVIGSSTDIEYTYPFDLNASPDGSWTQINGRWYFPIFRYVPNPLTGSPISLKTSFVSAVSVSRIDLYFNPATPLTQLTGTAEVKPVVFPTDNNSYQIAGDVFQQGVGDYLTTTDIETRVNVNRNGLITVALEYAGTLSGGQTPMTLDVDGAGIVTVWYRVGNDQ